MVTIKAIKPASTQQGNQQKFKSSASYGSGPVLAKGEHHGIFRTIHHLENRLF